MHAPRSTAAADSQPTVAASSQKKAQISDNYLYYYTGKKLVHAQPSI